MINMNQGDLFKLIVELNFANYSAIADAICKVSGLELHDLTQCISRIVNNKKNGKPFRNILPSAMTEGQFAEQFFQIIFKDCNIRNGANEHIAYEKFQKIKSYLSENQLTFNGLNTLEDSDNIKNFITTMIVEAFERHTCHVKSSTENPKVEIPTTIAASLHSQNIICPTQFFGRQDCLYKMRTMICSYKFVVLSGIGGIGKTYLSRRYAYEYSSYYKVKQIITYDKNLSSMKDVILSLKFDNLNDTNMNDSDKLEKRISLLNAMSEDTLLIIDNFDVKLSDMEYFDELRTNSNMHIIITTRLNDCFPPEQTININPMPIEDQLELFKFHYQEEITQEEIIKILNCIDGHTLLIELVAKSMHEGALLAPEMYAYLTGMSSETQLPP